MPVLSDLQTFAILRRRPQAATYDLVTRWVPKIASWLPGPDDKFLLKITITYSDRTTKYLTHGETIVDDEPTGDDVPYTTPSKQFMLDPPRRPVRMPFAPAADPNDPYPLRKQWLRGERPTGDVDCSIPVTQPFPYDREGFGVCHLLAASQPSSAAWRVRTLATPMIEEALAALQARGGSLSVLSTGPVGDVAKEIAESLAIYLVSRDFERDLGLPTAIVPAINAGLAELAEISAQLNESKGWSATTKLNWRQPVFTFVSVNPMNRASLLQPHASGTHAEQVERRYAYAAIITHCLSNRRNWQRLQQESDDAEQTRHQIRLRALHGGRLIDFSNSDAIGWSGTIQNSSEIVALGRTFSGPFDQGTGVRPGFSESEVASWRTVEVEVAHVPGTIDLSYNIPLPSIQTMTLAPSAEVQRAVTHPEERVERSSEESGEVSLASHLGGASYRLPYPGVRTARVHGISQEPTPPKSPFNGPHRIPRVNYDLMQTNVEQPLPNIQEVVPPEPTKHVGYNTGDGRLELVASFATDGTQAARTSGGFNVYILWKTDDPELKKYFEPWGNLPGQLSEDDWMTPDLDIIRPFLVTRRYSYLRDLREALKSAGGHLPASVSSLMADPPKQSIFPRADNVTDRQEEEQPTGGSRADESGVEVPMVKMPNAVHVDEWELQNGTVERLPLHAWSADLRKGTKSVPLQPGEVAEFLKYWDPAGGIDPSWNPERERDVHQPAGNKPQPYRIWITTTDFFDQESKPVPVYCHDSATGDPPEPLSGSDTHPDEWLFYPLRRGPIETPDSRTLEITEVAPRTRYDLKVSWKPPHYNSISAGPEQTPLPPPPDRDLVCYVVLFRRMIQDREERPQSFSKATNGHRSPTIPPFQQWDEACAKLTTISEDDEPWEGWEQFGDHHVIDGATVGGGVWNLTVPLFHYDRGYDYIALIGAQVKDDSRTAAFMAENVLNQSRRLQTVQWSEAAQDYLGVVRAVHETPRVSAPGRSNPERLPNAEEPRGVTLDAERIFHEAEHISPPPSIQRDLVLAKLLMHEVDAPDEWWYYDRSQQKVDPPEDEDWNVAARLNIAQKAMIESALVRTKDAHSIVSSATRKLLAQDFRFVSQRNEFTRGSYAQHATIGFRGIRKLKWTYKPLRFSESASISVDESEATVVRVWQVRVEADPRQASSYASARGVPRMTHLQDDIYECHLSPVSGASDLSGIEGLVCKQQPALIRLEPPSNASSTPWYGNVTEVLSYSPHSACVIRDGGEQSPPITAVTLRLAMTEKPENFPDTGVEAWLYLAQPLSGVDQQIPFNAATAKQELAIPVGGGPAEQFAWWVGTISARTTEAAHSRRAFATQSMLPTIEPYSPQDVRLAAPTDADMHVINPPDPNHPDEWENQKQWLPEFLQTYPQLIRITPHTVLTWRPYIAADRVGLAINRGRQEVLPPSSETLKRALHELPQWDVIKNVEIATDTEKLNPAWIARFIRESDGWLLGNVVEHPGGETSDSALDQFVPVANLGTNAFLSGASGIKRVWPPARSGVLFTADSASSLFARENHGLSNDDVLYLHNRGGTLPSGLSGDAPYYVVSATDNTFQLSSTLGGAAVVIGDNGTGTHLFHKHARHAAFLDYNLETTRESPMSVDYEYRYELVPYLDLGRGRYLRGKPSNITHWQRPENTPITVTQLSRSKGEAVDWGNGAYVRLEFATDENSMKMLRQLNEPTSWRYRIIVRRRLPYSLRPTASAKSAIGWEDVGLPISMWPETPLESVSDRNMERFHPDDEIIGLEYQIIVQQFAVFQDMSERPIRKQDHDLVLSDAAMSLGLSDNLRVKVLPGVAVPVPDDDQHEIGTVIKFLIS